MRGEAQGLFSGFKRNTILTNSGNLGITDEAEVQSSKKNPLLCLTQFNLVLVLFFSFFFFLTLLLDLVGSV